MNRRQMLGLSLVLAASPLVAQAQGDDVVRRAMTDEMARTAKELKLGNEPTPHYASYTVTDVEEVNGVSSFGAPTSTRSRRERNLRTELRVGDRTFDSGNFGEGGGSFSSASYPRQLPIEDDYLAIRRVIWLHTDDLYKRALDAWSKKKAARAARTEDQDRASFDFAEAKPASTQDEWPSWKAAVDQQQLTDLLNRTAKVLRDRTSLQDVTARGSHVKLRKRILTSDGGWKDERRSFVEIQLTAGTQADDGMRVSDWVVFQGQTLKDLPPWEEIEKRVRAMGDDVERFRSAPVGENGRAVVIFEERAPGQLLRRMLGDHLSGTPPTEQGAGGPPSRPGEASALAQRLGQRIGPKFLSVWDDPRARKGPDGVPLFGAFDADDEAVASEKVSLIEGGVLKSLLMSRTPRREITRSNGHARGRIEGGALRAATSTLFVSGGAAGLTDAALRARALKLAKELGPSTEVYIVRQIVPVVRLGEDERTGGSVVEPRRIYRLRNGKEEPVRGVRLANLRPSSLRDLVAVGKTQTTYNHKDETPLELGGSPGSVVAPALLFSDVEVRKDTARRDRPPLYPRPPVAAR